MEVMNATLNYTGEYMPEDTVMVRVNLTILFVCSIFSLVANGLIALIISNFRRLRKKKSNVIILNWAIVDALFLIIEPSTLRLGLDLNDTGVPEELFCIIEEIENGLMLLILFFVILLTFYWYYQKYNQAKLESLEKNLTKLILGLYVGTALICVLFMESCVSKRIMAGISGASLFLIILGFIVFMLVVNTIHEIKKRIYPQVQSGINVNYVLTNVFLLSNVPLLISVVVIVVFESSDILVFIFELVSTCNSIYNFIVLYKMDGDFNLFAKHVLKCKTDDYPEEFEPEMDNVRTRY